jgi:protein SCO1/2
MAGERRIADWFATMMSADAGRAGRPGPQAAHFPNVPLRTQDNRAVRFYDDLVKGKLVIISFMFTSCTDLCPRTTANLVKVKDALGAHAGRDVFLISVSVDPAHDTPAVLKKYTERFHTGPGWTFVTGRGEDVALIQRKLGVAATDDEPDHTGMIVYGNEATGSWSAMPAMLSPGTVARTVLRLVEKHSFLF